MTKVSAPNCPLVTRDEQVASCDRNQQDSHLLRILETDGDKTVSTYLRSAEPAVAGTNSAPYRNKLHPTNLVWSIRINKCLADYSIRFL